MVKVIKYRAVSEEMKNLVAPNYTEKKTRASLGFESNIGEFHYLSLDLLIPYENQARKVFDENLLNEMAESIKIHGILQPLSVIHSNKIEGKFEVISGERRLKAATIAGLEKIPCIIIDKNKKIEDIALIENIHRKDLNPIELGLAFKNFIISYNYTQEQLAQKLSISKSVISENIKFANMEPEVCEMILNNKLYQSKLLRELAKMSSKAQKIEKIKNILDNKAFSPIKNQKIININFDNIGALKSSFFNKKFLISNKTKIIDELKNLILQLEKM